jgi:predicted DNA-binding transcriptional regulator AlpA
MAEGNCHMADERPADFVLTRKQTAQRLGISVKTLSRMEARGEAPPRVKITARITGYRASALNQFLEARTV